MLNSKTLFLKFPFKADRSTVYLSKGMTKKKKIWRNPVCLLIPACPLENHRHPDSFEIKRGLFLHSSLFSKFNLETDFIQTVIVNVLI